MKTSEQNFQSFVKILRMARATHQVHYINESIVKYPARHTKTNQTNNHIYKCT